MKTAFRNTFAIITVSGMALATVAVVGVTRAQGQQPGGNGQDNGFGQIPGRRVLPPGAISRLIQGTITAGDAAAGTITINTTIGTTQVISVTANTTMKVRETILEKDLKIGDMVQVQGVPTGISASSIIDGEPPPFRNIGGPRAFGGPDGPGGPGAPGGGVVRAGQLDANGNPPPQGPPPANAMANGKVVSTSPLTISVSENMDIVLKLAHDAKLTRYSTIPFGNLKVGDTIVASGAMIPGGNYAAAAVGINMTVGDVLGGGPSGGFGPGGGFGGGRVGGPNRNN